MWHTMITNHPQMAPRVAIEEMYTKACSGTIAFAATPTSMAAPEASTASAGTCPELVVLNLAGASPSPAKRLISRALLNRPELHEDSAAVSTTKFMMVPAAGSPIWVSALTNGLSPALNSVHGNSDSSTINDPM